MPTEFLIDDAFVEKSTGVITLNFKDEDGQPKDPETAKWTLTDDLGNVINSRENVVIASPTSEENIVLSGLDLALSDGFAGNAEWRVLLVQATYDSTFGSDLPLNDFVRFPVRNAVAITNT